MLHFGAGFVGHAITPRFAVVADAQGAQDAGQGGVFDLDTVLLLEFFVDALDPTVALAVELAQEFGIQLGFGGVRPLGHLAALANDEVDGFATEAELTGDLSHRNSFLVQEEDGFTRVGFDHGIGSGFCERWSFGQGGPRLRYGPWRRRLGT